MNINDLTKDLDRNLAYLGVLSSIILIIFLVLFIKRPIYILTGVLTLTSCLIWLIIRKNTQDITKLTFKINSSFYYIINIAFFVLLTVSILLFYFRTDVYIIPTSYFVIISLMIMLVFFEIIFYTSKRNIYFILPKIMIIGLSLSLSKVMLFPDVVGIDPIFHKMFTLKILETNYIPDGFAYSRLPIFNIEIVLISLITNSSYKISSILSWGLMKIILDVLFIFLLGKFLFDDKIGALSGLLISIANYEILNVSWLIPSGVSSIFILLIIYFLFKFKNTPLIISILLLIMFSLVLTHTIGSAFIAIILFVLWINKRFIKRFNLTPEKNFYVSGGIAILFSTLMFTWWIYASNYINTLANLINWGFTIDYFIIAPKGVFEYAANVPIFEQLLSNLGIFLFFAFSFIGSFYMISKKFRNSYTISLVTIGMAPLFIGFFSIITGHTILEARWWYYAQIFLSIPLAVTIMILISRIRNNTKKSAFLAVFSVLLSLLMIMSFNVVDNNVFYQNTGVRYAFTTSEITAASFFSEKITSNISSDFDYSSNPSSSVFINNYNVKMNNIIPLDNSLYEKKFFDDGSIKLIREYIVKKPFRLSGLTYKLNYDPREPLDADFNRIYDSTRVIAYQ